MKYIIPENYDYKNKLFGILDYKSAIFILVFIIIVWKFFSLFIKSIITLISFMIIICLPIILLIFYNSTNENLINILYYFIKFLIKPKIYFYM